MLEAAEVCVGCDRAAGATAPNVVLAGDFDNQNKFPSLFDWLNGGLSLSGPGTQTFEVAGLDLGPTPEGFGTDQDTLFDAQPHTNFAVGRIAIGSAAHATFVQSPSSHMS